MEKTNNLKDFIIGEYYKDRVNGYGAKSLFLLKNGITKLYDRFGDKLTYLEYLWIKENYTTKQTNQSYITQNKKLREQVKNFEEEIQPEIQKRVDERLDKINTNFERKYHNKINDLELDIYDREKEIEELNKKIAKWQAMYTGQCEANRILINKLRSTNE